MSLPSRLPTLPLQVLVIPPWPSWERGSLWPSRWSGHQHAPWCGTVGVELPFIAGKPVINPTCDS